MVEAKKVYEGLAAARDHLAKEGLGKNQTNQHQGFKFRGIDDLYGILQPALAHSGIVMVPDIEDVSRREYTTANGKLQFYTVVRVGYALFSIADGSSVRVAYPGEAADTGDKSLSKALTMAFKSFCFHVFQIPLNGNDDADKHVADATSPPPIPEDVEITLVDASKEGLDSLKAAWKEVSPETRELITQFYPVWWAELKGHAQSGA